MTTNPRSKIEKLKQIFWSTIQISATTFGGGFVIVPLMRKKFVEELGWIDEEEMLDLVAIAQSSPGAIAVNAAIIVGYHIAGLAGAATAAIGTILPPFIIISIISIFYREFRDNKFVSLIMAGMLAGVAAVILDAVINLAKQIFKLKRILPIIVMLVSFIATYFFRINILMVIGGAALTGLIDSLYQAQKRKREKLS